MRRALPLLLGLLVPALAPAQQQEEGMLARMNAKSLRAMQAINSNEKDPSLASSLQGREFRSRNFEAKSFATESYAGTRAAGVGRFQTRSFLGIKNPWFGRKTYETNPSALTDRSDRDAQRKVATETFATREFGADRDLPGREKALSPGTEPRPFVVQGKRQGALDRFTENLGKDLSIDDVRDLLNKGKGAGAGGTSQP